MPIVTAKTNSSTTIFPASRTLSTLGGATKVTGWNNLPAAGRHVIILGKSIFGGVHEIKGEALTDANGDFSVSLNAGPNDRFTVVYVGDINHDEYTRVFGNITGVV